MKKLVLILAFCIVLISSVYAEITTNDYHVWETEDNNYTVCTGADNYINFTNGNEACTFRYGDAVILSICNSEYKMVSGCGLAEPEKARLCSCIHPSEFTELLIRIDNYHVWQKDDENFAFCSNGALSVVSNGNDACTTKYNRTSSYSQCAIYRNDQLTECGTISGASRLCECRFPSGTEKPELGIFNIEDITVTPSTPSETPSSPSSAPTGGGGGGGHTNKVNAIVSKTSVGIDIVNGVGIYYDLGNKGTFDFKGEKHEVYLKQIKGNSVIMVFESTPIEVELSLGERKNIDINEDNKEDLGVALINIYGDKAEVKIKEIVEKKEEIKLEEEKKEGIDEITGSAVSEFRARDYAIGATLILLAGIFVFLIIRIVKKVA